MLTELGSGQWVQINEKFVADGEHICEASKGDLFPERKDL
jgi:hypothetical protein